MNRPCVTLLLAVAALAGAVTALRCYDCEWANKDAEHETASSHVTDECIRKGVNPTEVSHTNSSMAVACYYKKVEIDGEPVHVIRGKRDILHDLGISASSLNDGCSTAAVSVNGRAKMTTDCSCTGDLCNSARNTAVSSLLPLVSSLLAWMIL